jgi:hypothetical protein
VVIQEKLDCIQTKHITQNNFNCLQSRQLCCNEANFVNLTEPDKKKFQANQIDNK